MLPDIDQQIEEHGKAQRAPFYAWVRFLVTLDVSVLALSVSIQNISPHSPDGARRWLLLSSWALLLTSAILGALRAAGEFHDHRRYKDSLKAMRQRNLSDQEIREAIARDPIGIGATRTEKAIGWISAIAFVLGLVSLMAFSLWGDR